MRLPTLDPYGPAAVLYDMLSLEWPIYRRGRIAAVEALGLERGDRVLDLGCGTGLNLRHLLARVGSTGHVVGVDASPDMLGVAARRVRRRGWANVTLVRGDATSLDPGAWAPVDAALATYVLSVVPDPGAGWRVLRAGVRPGGRVAVVDMADPRGPWRALRPATRTLTALGGADIEARPWRAVEDELVDVSRAAFWGGHVQVRVGTVPEG